MKDFRKLLGKVPEKTRVRKTPPQIENLFDEEDLRAFMVLPEVMTGSPISPGIAAKRVQKIEEHYGVKVPISYNEIDNWVYRMSFFDFVLPEGRGNNERYYGFRGGYEKSFVIRVVNDACLMFPREANWLLSAVGVSKEKFLDLAKRHDVEKSFVEVELEGKRYFAKTSPPIGEYPESQFPPERIFLSDFLKCNKCDVVLKMGGVAVEGKDYHRAQQYWFSTVSSGGKNCGGHESDLIWIPGYRHLNLVTAQPYIVKN